MTFARFTLVEKIIWQIELTLNKRDKHIVWLNQYILCTNNLTLFLFIAICRPLSSLVYKKRRVIMVMIIIWSLSLFISIPELLILTSVGFLNDKDMFPCVTEEIYWDLTACLPTWSNNSVFIYTIIKVNIVLIICFTMSLFEFPWKHYFKTEEINA